MQGYQLNLLVCLAVTFGLATVSLVLRLVARRMTAVPLWWDDYLGLLAYLFSIAWSIVIIKWIVDAGLGLKLDQIPGDNNSILMESTFLLYNAEIFYAASLAFSKLSILGFYWRLFKTSNIRLPIQILVVSSIVWLIIRTFMAIFHCVPVEAFWDKTIENATCNIDDSKFFFGTVLVHLLIDICILALPVVQVKHLHLRLGQKIGVIGLFMFGILVCVGSIVVLVESKLFDPLDIELPHNITAIIIWATVEINLAIVSACLPMMRPIFKRLTPGSALNSDPSKYGNISRSAGGKGIKLNTITTRVKEANESSETSSTRQLADDVERGSNHSNEYDRPHGGGLQGPQTVISGHSYVPPTPTAQASAEGSGMKGIHIKNEMSVSYESAYKE